MNTLDWTTWSGLTDILPQGDFLWGFVLLGISFISLWARGIFTAIGPKNRYWKKSIGKRYRWFWALGTVGIILVLSRIGEVPYLSMRLLLLIWMIALICIGGYQKVKIFLDYRKRIASARREGKDI